MKAICLGTTGYDVSQQTGFGFVLQGNKSVLLLDCGPYALQALRNTEYSPNDIDILFVSHAHPDHCIGLPWFLNSLMMDEYYKEYNISQKKIIFPNARNNNIVTYLEKQFGWMLGKDTIDICTSDDSSYEIGEFKLTIFPLHHSVENYGVIISNDMHKVVYVPDFVADQSPELSAALKNADLAIMSIAGSSRKSDEAKQFCFSTATDVAKLATSCNVKTVWGFHLFYENDQEAVEAEMGQGFSGVFSIPSANQSVVL